MRVELDDADEVLDAFSGLSSRQKEEFIKGLLDENYIDLDMIHHMFSSLTDVEKKEVLEDFVYLVPVPTDKDSINDLLDGLKPTYYREVKEWVEENAKYHFE